MNGLPVDAVVVDVGLDTVVEVTFCPWTTMTRRETITTRKILKEDMMMVMTQEKITSNAALL